MKTVYINESTLQHIRESVLKDALPDDIVSSIMSHRTSIGNNPSIPDIFDTPFLLKLVQSRFEETKDELKKIGTIDDVDETDAASIMAKLLLRCQEIEKPYRSELEKVCFNYVVDLFQVPEETVQIVFTLTDEIDLGRPSILLDPIDGDGDDGMELSDVNDALALRDEIYKRRMLDVICMGGAMQMSSNIESYEESINAINPELCDLYKKIIALNNYLMFEKDILGMTDKNKMQLGTVEVSFASNLEKVKIEAQGKIFPVLLSEAIRGFMELFVSHGLPKDKQKAIMVMGKSDYLKAEPWDMRIGPSVWTALSNTFSDIDSEEVPYLLKRISCLEPSKFNYLFKEVLAKTKKGKSIMYRLSARAKRDVEYDKFADKMTKMKQDKGVITDEFIHPDEL